MFEEITAGYNFIDWMFVVWMVFSIALGLFRGFIAEMLSLIGWIVAFGLAFQYGEEIGKMIPLPIKEDTIVYVVGFIAVFIASLVGWAVVKTMLRFAVGHGWIDHVLGFLFGIIRGVLISAIVVGVASIIFPLPQQNWWKKAQYHEFLEDSAREIKALLPEAWGRRMQLDIENIKKKIPTTIPEVYDSIPSSVKDDVVNKIKEDAINSVLSNRKTQTLPQNNIIPNPENNKPEVREPEENNNNVKSKEIKFF